ncbi:MAG: type I restriction enzyme M protein [Sulfurimonas sp.]|jgi:type I restriction enzyme M protein
MDSNQKDLIVKLQFTPKENSINIYQKKYLHHYDYNIEIDLDKNSIDFGKTIFFNDSKNSTQKVTKAEDLVVLECVDRLLSKGYKPNNIILEKVYPSGHGTSGRLDILVTREDNSAYMMIECKTWGKEFDKAFTKLNKDGGQLFTYFQQDKDAEVLVLYASQLNGNEIEHINQIIKIEEEYRTTSNVKDFFDRWNKTPKNNGIFNSWCEAYDYKSKALTPKELIEITSEDSSKIFNRFMEILRHNVVSDKPNAFSKIFTLFLCKIMDEKDTKLKEELGFQWVDGKDTHISFQKRLTDLYQKGMKEFLDKEVTDLSDAKFEEKFGSLDNSLKKELLEEFTKIRLQKNNEFAIKDVFDQDTFEENAIVVKEVVELLQNYQIRYTKKQQFLSDFFELLLTTGLKQEVGQFFTPVPIAKFIIRSIPFDKIIQDKLSKGIKDELLPNVIDYAVGSGHFITEAMDEIQKYINNTNQDEFISDTARKLKSWKVDHFDWAYDYVYGIEKDYRLVKTAKVGCYLHGDGLAKVIHGDGLANFTETKEYKGKLTKRDDDYHQDNKQFDLVISNPPYSVSAFKNISKKFDGSDFELYEKLTDQSSEIEALFIERTKQLLKDGGIAGIILPSSILSNGGIYTKTREIIFKYFDIVSITELGSNTFMATGTNTVVLFLRRKNNAVHKNIQASVEKLFEGKKDITINGIEKPLEKYVNHVFEDISIEDYLTLLDKNPNEAMKAHEIYQEYDKKLGNFERIIELEKEKVFYFISAYSQKITLVKTGEKKSEKKFLGYEFSSRRGSEGIHPIQRSKTIDECTSLYDEISYSNSLKVNSYIYSAFNGEFNTIDESLKDNISYVDLVDMMTFDRVDFEKNISLSIKKRVKIESKWDLVQIKKLSNVITKGTTPTSIGYSFQNSGINFIKIESIEYNGDINNKLSYISSSCNEKLKRSQLKEHDILFSIAASFGKIAFVNRDILPANTNQALSIIRLNNEHIYPKYALSVLKSSIIKQQIERDAIGIAQYNLSLTQIGNFKIPLPPKEIQEKIVKEIEELEKVEKDNQSEIEIFKSEINKIIDDLKDNKFYTIEKISNNLDSKRKPVTAGHRESGKYPYYGASGIVDYVHDYLIDDTVLLISEDGANLKSRVYPIAFTASGKIWVNNHAHVLKFKHIETHKLTKLYLNHTDLSEYITGQAQPKLNQKNLNSIKIPLPSIEEQTEIVKQIELIEKKIQKKEQELANIPEQKEAILEKYLK